MKEELRKLFLTLLQGHDVENKKQKEAKIQLSVEELIQEKQWKRIGLYASLSEEVSTKSLREKLLEEGKELYLPKGNSLETGAFYLYRGEGYLQKNSQGFLEPLDSPALSVTELDGMFVPLVAIDNKGKRLGRGGGFYDRLLALGVKFTCGLAFKMQTVPGIPDDMWDQPLNAVITEEGLHHFKALKSG